MKKWRVGSGLQSRATAYEVGWFRLVGCSWLVGWRVDSIAKPADHP